MSDQDEFARALLAPLRGELTMPTAVDVTKATRVGRRRLRVRRTAIGIVAVTALTGVIVGSLITYGTRQGLPGLPADAPTSFDPRRRLVTVAGAPDPRGRGRAVDRRTQVVFVTVARTDGPPIHASVVVNPARRRGC